MGKAVNWGDSVRFLTETEGFLVTIAFGPALGSIEPEVSQAPSQKCNRHRTRIVTDTEPEV